MLGGHDLMVCAQTGTGNTAAFMLHALQRLAADTVKRPIGAPRILVLTPTRELAQQVTDAALTYGKFLHHARIAAIVGGVSYMQQNRALAQSLEILVATPGWLTDHLNRARLDLSRMELLVLDEADRMLDMGFVEAVEHIAKATPASRQTVLFSATLDGAIARLAKRILRDPQLITVEGSQASHDTGLVVIGQGDTLNEQERTAIGDAPNIAARLQALAEPGSVVVSDRTHQLAAGSFDHRPLGAQDLKGVAEPMSAWQALGERTLETRFDATTGALAAPMVGRGMELDVALRSWQTASQGKLQSAAAVR
jgi:hypothetical protein